MSHARDFSLHVITDTSIQKRFSHEDLALLACAGGADVIQLRDKQLSDNDLLAVARRVRAICERYGVVMIMNDRVDVARACGIGVHVGRDDTPIADARRALGAEACIGTTASSPDEVRAAQAAGADYAGFGHVFATSSKQKSGPPLGLDAVRAATAGAGIPLIAIGGINATNARDVIRAGAWGVAVIGAVVKSDNPEAATRALRAAIDGA